MLKVAKLCLLRYLSLVLEEPLTLERPLRINATIDTFTDSVCWNYFECRKADLRRLLVGLQLDQRVTLENGSRMPGEEVMLRGLFELVSGNDQFDICEGVLMNPAYGRNAGCFHRMSSANACHRWSAVRVSVFGLMYICCVITSFMRHSISIGPVVWLFHGISFVPSLDFILLILRVCGAPPAAAAAAFAPADDAIRRNCASSVQI